MHLRHHKAYNLIRNYGLETARLMAETQYDDEERMATFELTAVVYEIFKEELAVGKPFCQAMAEYVTAQNEATRALEESYEVTDSMTMAKNLYHAIKAITKSRCEFTKIQEYQRRLDICRQCEYLIPTNRDRLRCGKCGCYMIVKAKFQVMTCPADKW